MKFLKKSDERKLLDLSNGSFKSIVSKYLKENIELSEKVKKRIYKLQDIEQIVQEYNDWKTLQHHN